MLVSTTTLFGTVLFLAQFVQFAKLIGPLSIRKISFASLVFNNPDASIIVVLKGFFDRRERYFETSCYLVPIVSIEDSVFPNDNGLTDSI